MYSANTDHRKEKLSKFLFKKHMEHKMSEGYDVSQAEFAMYLDVDKSAFSNWITGKTLPGYQNIFNLAHKLGEEVYDIMGVPKAVTENKLLRFIIDNFERLPQEEQSEFVVLLKKKIVK